MPFRWVAAAGEVAPGSALLAERAVRAMRWLLCWTGAVVVLALVVSLGACSTECEREAAKVCKAAQQAIFDTCVKRATAKACKAEEAAAFGTFDTCVRNEVSRCRGG